jgi:hypothetical protein
MIADARSCRSEWTETPQLVIVTIGHLNFSQDVRARYHY